jgi:L-gulonolactone oxidase
VALQGAARDGLRARAVGAGHSFSGAACTDGVMLRLRKMNRVLDADPASGMVRVQAGISLHELSPELEKRGLALENLGDIDVQVLAGALATGTHGTGGRYGSLASQVAGMKLVTASGEVVEFTAGDDLLDGAAVSLGALGVVTEVTLRCQPAFTMRRVDALEPLEDVLGRLDELVDSSEHFEFFTFPYGRLAFTRARDRTDEQAKPPSRLEHFAKDVLLENGVFGALCIAGKRFPRLVPRLNRFANSNMATGTRIEPGYRLFATVRAVRFVEMEYAIPREHTADAVREVLDLVERRRLPVQFPLEVRFGRAEAAWLATAHGRDTGYIAVHVYRGTEFESYFRGVTAIMERYEGRPHWGKRHYLSALHLRDLYPRFGEFLAIREKLDPQRLFANDYTDLVIGNW